MRSPCARGDEKGDSGRLDRKVWVRMSRLSSSFWPRRTVGWRHGRQGISIEVREGLPHPRSSHARAAPAEALDERDAPFRGSGPRSIPDVDGVHRLPCACRRPRPDLGGRRRSVRHPKRNAHGGRTPQAGGTGGRGPWEDDGRCRPRPMTRVGPRTRTRSAGRRQTGPTTCRATRSCARAGATGRTTTWPGPTALRSPTS